MTDEFGMLGNPKFPTAGGLRPFRLCLSGDLLHYTFIRPNDLGKMPLDPLPNSRVPYPFDAPEAEVKGALDAFIRITNDGDILNFARRFGVLRICNHDLPASHTMIEEECSTEIERKRRPACQLISSDLFGNDWLVESTSAWHFYVGQARSMLTVASKVHRDEPTTKRDWVPLGMKWESLDGHHGLTESNQLWILERAVNTWLQWGGVVPLFFLDRQRGHFELVGSTFGALAIQLMFAVSQRQSLALCSGCGTPYLREGKRAQAGRRNFCPPCQESPLPARLRKRDHDKRRHDEKNGKPKEDRDGVQ